MRPSWKGAETGPRRAAMNNGWHGGSNADRIAAPDDPDMELVTRIVERLQRNPAARLHTWTVTVIKNAHIANAMALPSGHIVVYQGLLEVANRDPDELAYLLGHEMAHVICRHGSERLSVARVFDNALNVLFFSVFAMLGDAFGFASMFSFLFVGDKVASVLASLSHSRDNELEADRVRRAPPALSRGAHSCHPARSSGRLWRRRPASTLASRRTCGPKWRGSAPRTARTFPSGAAPTRPTSTGSSLWKAAVGRRKSRTDPTHTHTHFAPFLFIYGWGCRAALEALMPEVLASSSSVNCPPAITARARAFFRMFF